MTFGGDEGSLCFELRPSQSMLTQDVATAPSTGPVTLNALELSDGAGVTLVDSFILPGPPGSASVGAARYEPGDKRWRDRAPLAGTVLGPGESADVTAVLTRDGADPGRAAALVLTYIADDKVYRRMNTTEYLLANSCE